MPFIIKVAHDRLTFYACADDDSDGSTEDEAKAQRFPTREAAQAELAVSNSLWRGLGQIVEVSQ
jgi:hypothetical protein